MKWTILALVGLTAIATPRAEAQEARERARAALPPDVFARVEALASDAGARGVPDEPIFNKALEGIAKGVPAARLFPAIELYTARLGEARAALGAGASVSLVVAGADAIRRGVPGDALPRIGDERARTPVAVLVLAELVETGVPTDRALDVLREAIRARAREGRMLDIPEQVRRLVRDGAAPHDAADLVRQRLRRGGRDAGPPVPPGSEPTETDATRRHRGG